MTGLGTDPALVDFQDTSLAHLRQLPQHDQSPVAAVRQLRSRRHHEATIQVVTPVAGSPTSKLSDWLAAGEPLSIGSVSRRPTSSRSVRRWLLTRHSRPAWPPASGTGAMSRGDVVVDDPDPGLERSLRSRSTATSGTSKSSSVASTRARTSFATGTRKGEAA